MRGTIQQAIVAYACWIRDAADAVVSTREKCRLADNPQSQILNTLDGPV